MRTVTPNHGLPLHPREISAVTGLRRLTNLSRLCGLSEITPFSWAVFSHLTPSAGSEAKAPGPRRSRSPRTQPLLRGLARRCSENERALAHSSAAAKEIKAVKSSWAFTAGEYLPVLSACLLGGPATNKGRLSSLPASHGIPKPSFPPRSGAGPPALHTWLVSVLAVGWHGSCGRQDLF